MDELIDLIRQEVATVAAMRNWRGTVVATAYDPKKHAMRGILVPHEVETGWIPIGAHGIGNGFGDAIAPKIGDPQKLDGDQFSVQFDAGDANTIVATHRIFSDEDKPPELQAGEMVRLHEKGARLLHDQDGNLILDLRSGTKVKLKANNDVVVMPAGGAMAYLGGDPSDGGSFDFLQTVSGQVVNVKGKIG